MWRQIDKGRLVTCGLRLSLICRKEVCEDGPAMHSTLQVWHAACALNKHKVLEELPVVRFALKIRHSFTQGLERLTV